MEEEKKPEEKRGWFATHWPWVLLAISGALAGYSYWMQPATWTATWWGVPRWAFAVTLVGLPLANEGVRLSKWTAAQSLLNGLIRMLVKMFGTVPILGDFLKAMDKPAPDVGAKSQGGEP